MKKLRMILMAGGFPVILAVAGCATDSEFKQKAQPSSSAIVAAERSGATDVPSAAFYLGQAKAELDSAKALATDGKKRQAASLLLRAEADAELAAALSQEDAEKKDAADAVKNVRQLRQDNQLPLNEDGDNQ